jgi:hypothetical protein
MMVIKTVSIKSRLQVLIQMAPEDGLISQLMKIQHASKKILLLQWRVMVLL